MRGNLWFKRILWSIVLIVACSGCTHADNQSGFVGSSIDAQFPVPVRAEITDHTSQDNSIHYVRYKLKGLQEEDSIPAYYLAKLQESGWIEQQDAQMGALRVFKKEEKIMNLTTHTGFFTLYTKKSG
ncbi:hypothetical protein SAMN02799630_03306 [Paenibacillus sp. UNCCL117]|uniref:hypothetical protein n=1 Tax=unclassified Paenibacillus TaxID=185978 RepID=UPI00088C438B|nr:MULTISPECIES: hypothetical protein [unclassified Paenibacillus]SDD72238.1 hypothetical protein SAMN04488602_112121 [Paenibacillus sp. cl123]SFW45687.1 hypothetical protein SAMN02799630_03306 [Paenibacillus sp. UNCCL117]